MHAGAASDPLAFLAEFLTGAASTIAARAAALQVEANEALNDNFEDLRSDCRERVHHLAEAVALEAPELFADQVRWSSVAFRGRGIATDMLPSSLIALSNALDEIVPNDLRTTLQPSIEHGLAAAREPAAPTTSIIESLDPPWRELAQGYFDLVIEGDRVESIAWIERALDAGHSPAEITDRILTPVQGEFGRLWHLGSMSVADEHVATEISREVLNRLAPPPVKLSDNAPRMLTLAVAGDQHDFGIRVVTDRFRAAGWHVDALGANVPPLDLVGRALRINPHAVAISVSLSTLMRPTRRLIQLLRTDSVLRSATVIVGGPPFGRMPNLWRRLGADLCSNSPSEAVELVSRRLPSES